MKRVYKNQNVPNKECTVEVQKISWGNVSCNFPVTDTFNYSSFWDTLVQHYHQLTCYVHCEYHRKTGTKNKINQILQICFPCKSFTFETPAL